MKTVLDIRDLSIGIKNDKILVKNINLSIEEGEVHGLIGESGSGKSLTAMSILRLLPAGIEILNGDIELNSNGRVQYLNSLSKQDLLKVRGIKAGVIFQDPMTSLNPSIKCGNQVGEVLVQHGLMNKSNSKDEVMRLFNKVKITNPEKIYKAYPHEISGGQRQRVMIAMAVACKPKLLIADEITTALDVTVQKSIIELIDELRKSEGLSVLFITHDLSLITAVANRISIMLKGEIVESGLKENILKTPQHAYTKGLLACKPPIDRQLDRLQTVEESMLGKSISKTIISSEKENYKDPKTLLKVDNLEVFYELKRNIFGKVSSEMHVLKDINLELLENESVGLIGESGSGKSTLGRSLLKLTEVRSGNITYRGKSLVEMSDSEFKSMRRKMQFIFQDPYASLNPKMMVGEAILEPLNVHGIGDNKVERKEMVMELLQKVGLSASDYSKYPHQFSGGQRQRIVIARALSVRPEFIVCDEAVSALDVSVQAKILNLLKDLKDEFQLTFLFITHDMSVVRFFCDKILVMNDGEIIESGRVNDIFEQPKHIFTKELIQASH